VEFKVKLMRLISWNIGHLALCDLLVTFPGRLKD